jgi:hypothetical protein
MRMLFFFSLFLVFGISFYNSGFQAIKKRKGIESHVCTVRMTVRTNLYLPQNQDIREAEFGEHVRRNICPQNRLIETSLEQQSGEFLVQSL